MRPSEQLEVVLEKHVNSPFLFIGSGFSLRYLGLPSWAGLLERFCEHINPFEYYRANSDGEWPRCASLIAKDFGEYWWKSPDCAEMRSLYKADTQYSQSPLKIAISDFMKAETQFKVDPVLSDEIEAFQALNLEGIVTTNYDQLLESLFPDYKVYIGQRSVVTQTPQNVAEIYKIHGCCSSPNSLVLTQEDYDRFSEQQAYLAAKLMTIFVEHPVVFIGYSLSDKNIAGLLQAIMRGLGSEEIKQLQENLIFVQWASGSGKESVQHAVIVVEDTPLPVRQLVTDDYLSIY